MTSRETYLTKGGREKLQEELERLRAVGRQEVAERIQLAKEIGGTVDNAEYDETKNEQAFMEGRILTLEKLLSKAVVITRSRSLGGIVGVGSAVLVVDGMGVERRHTIVGRDESNPQEGRISNESPVGQALLGQAVGSEVEVKVPSGVIKLRVLAVE